MSTKLQNVVVVGGGLVGSGVAKDLAAKLNPSTHTLTLITSRPIFTSLPALLRTTVTSEGALETKTFMSYSDFLVNPKTGFKGTIKVGKVVEVTSEEGGKGGGEVVLEGGERVRYSVLVLATGNTWTGPLDLPDTQLSILESVTSWRAKFAQAKNIVFVGAGAVGIEYAGEIRDFYPEKKVTLVHGDALVLNGAYPEGWRRKVGERVRRGGVELVLEDKVEQVEPGEDGTVRTVKGKVIKADLVVPTWGGKPNTSFIASSLGDDTLTATGHVKVKPTLQLEKYPRIFAAGDIIEWDEQKQAAKGAGHSSVISTNILALLNGTGAVVPYKGSVEMIVVTFGRNGGSAYLGFLWGLTFGDWFARSVKSKTLMLDMTRSKAGFEFLGDAAKAS